MGIIHNHALILNAGDTESLRKSVAEVQAFASRFFSLGEASPFSDLIVVVPSAVNFTVTVFMAPDGSKEGWQTSHNSDTIRAFFIEELSQYGEIIEVQWGEFGKKMEVH